MDVHRLSGIGSGELAGCAGQVSPSMGVQSASRLRRKRHRRAEKAHWHILLSFGGKKGYGQIWSISEAINGTRPQVCQDQKALIRYFSHRDNPEKAQYKSSDIEVRGGFDLEEYLKPTASECMAMQDEMVEWCLKYNVTEFHVLKIYAIRERPDWSAELSRSCFQITQFLKSRRHGGGVKACNPETGEVYE